MIGERKLAVGICDDEEKDLKRMEEGFINCLEEMEIGILPEICLYSDGKQMFREATSRRFNLAFLDLEMPGCHGFDLAERLHMASPETMIIFVSSHESLVYPSFEYTPLWFVRKGQLQNDMMQALRKYFMLTVHMEGKYRIKEGYSCREIRIADIRYIECSGHTMTIRTGGGDQYQKYGSLKSEEEELGKHGFIRIHKNFLVNVGYIDKVGQKCIILKDGTELDMGRDRKKAVVEGMVRYGRKHS